MPLLRILIAFLAAGLAALAAQAQTGEEVPFITSPDNVTLEMLRLAEVSPRDYVVDLGSGDGRIVILAAKRFGAGGLGVDIDPRLVDLSNRHARDANVSDRVQFRVQDLFETDLSRASVITMYLLPEVNLQLRDKLLALKPGTRVVSHDWDMGDWMPDLTTTLQVPDKAVGREKSSKVHLWIVPAHIGGLWCAGGASLQVAQEYQQVEARIVDRGSELGLAGRVEGNKVRLTAEGSAHPTVLELVNGKLRFVGRPVEFVPAQGTSC